jgi:hypothetical protein
VRAPLALAAVAALALQGCAAAFVQTSEPGAAIYVDGRRVPPDGKVPNSVGPPHTARVLVVASDGRRARTTVSRRPWLGLSLAAYGLWPCLLVCWNYESPIVVSLPPPAPRAGWDTPPGESAWERAPGAGWIDGPVAAPSGPGAASSGPDLARPRARASDGATPEPAPASSALPSPHRW